MSNVEYKGGGTSILGLLGVVFVALKLTGFIGWSWWYVTLPFWGGAAVLLAVGVIALVFWAVISLVLKALK